MAQIKGNLTKLAVRFGPEKGKVNGTQVVRFSHFRPRAHMIGSLITIKCLNGTIRVRQRMREQLKKEKNHFL